MSRGADRRVARSRAAVLDATVDLLVEVGYEALTIEGVAARSGVAKTTVYRHWPGGREDLVLDAIARVLTPVEVPAGPSSSLRDRLVAHLERLGRMLDDARVRPVVADLVSAAERHPALAERTQDFVRARQAHLRALLAAAVDAGELPGGLDAERAVPALAGPIFYQRLMARGPVGRRLVEHVVDGFLAAPPTR